MKTNTIIDPRVTQADLDSTGTFHPLAAMEEWGSYEVFHQKKRGDHHVHSGTVHAPDPEMALLFAKEQFGRRLHCSSIWVVRTADIYSLGYENEDMFETTPDKTYREASGYKVRNRINDFKKEIAVKTSTV